MSLRDELDALAGARGFAALRVARAVEDLEARRRHVERIERGDFDGLAWFDEDRARRATTPSESLDGARSIVFLAGAYASVPPPADGELRGRVARYAWGRDYHNVLKNRARPLLGLLGRTFPGSRSRFVADWAALAERDYARGAGLGWQGKNAMLLVRGAGSWTVLGAILTTAELEPDPPVAASCGSCVRCLPSCPTGALRREYEVVSDLCIAFHTIENRGPIPRELRPRFGDWIFGCDLCQETCPVNDAAWAPPMTAFLPTSVEDARPSLAGLLALDEAAFEERYAGRPVRRAGWKGLLRNACVALGNAGDERAVPPLRLALDHPEPLVRGHAAWALGRYGDAASLERRGAVEREAAILAEIDHALAEARGAAVSA